MFHAFHHGFSFQKSRVEEAVAFCPEFQLHALPGVALAMGINCCLWGTRWWCWANHSSGRNTSLKLYLQSCACTAWDTSSASLSCWWSQRILNWKGSTGITKVQLLSLHRTPQQSHPVPGSIAPALLQLWTWCSWAKTRSSGFLTSEGFFRRREINVQQEKYLFLPFTPNRTQNTAKENQRQ